MSAAGSRRPFSRRPDAAAAAVLLAAATLACHPAAAYRPRDWRAAGSHRWAATVDEMELETRGLHPLPDAKGVAAELTIHNSSLSPIAVLGARLETAAGLFETPTDPERRPPEVGPGQTERVPLSFPIGGPAAEALAEPATLVVAFRTAGERREVAIPLQRE